MKATRHNGRSGKNGTYNPRHNDRRFDLENSEHIDAGRVRENIYWDCYRGYTTMQNREEDSQDISFEKIECTFYQEHYGKYIEAQNERNARTRHTERNRSVEDLLKNNKTCVNLRQVIPSTSRRTHQLTGQWLPPLTCTKDFALLSAPDLVTILWHPSIPLCHPFEKSNFTNLN